MQAQAGLVNCTKPEMACVTAVYTAAKHVLHCATCFCKAFQRRCNCKKTSQLPSDVEKQMYVSACLAAVYTQLFCSLCSHFTPGLKLSLIMLHAFEVASELLSEKFSSLWELLRTQFALNCVCCIVYAAAHTWESFSFVSAGLACSNASYSPSNVLTWQYGIVMVICRKSLLAIEKQWLSQNK